MFDAIQLQNRMKTVPSTEFQRPRLAWRAWLSLAPVLALVGIGSWMLLLEQRLAKQEAQEALQLSARGLLEELEQNVPIFAWFDGWSGIEEVDIFKQNHALFISVDEKGRCLLPPLVIQPPLPEPSVLPWDQLDESQIHLWSAIKKTEDAEQLLESVQAFHQTSPPEPFFSLAEFRRIAVMASDSQWDFFDILDSIQRLREDLVGTVYTESGLPLSVALDFQEFNLFKRVLTNDIMFLDTFLEFGNRQVKHPSPWTYQLLGQRLATLEESPIFSFFPNRFLTRLHQREKARRLHATISQEEWSKWSYLNSANPRWIDFEGMRYLVCRVFQGEVYHFVALDAESLESQFGSRLKDWIRADSVNQVFSFSVDIQGQSFQVLEAENMPSTGENSEANIQNNGYSTLIASTYPWFSVRAEILNPESYFARSRQRTRSMLWLIGLAGVTGVVGWVAQWKAFRRQVELGRMKSNFVASVSHELRAPIASIRLMTENLSYQKGRTDAERQDYFQWIGLECRRLSALVQNILQFSRLELGKRDCSFEAVDITRLFEETLRLMEPLAASVEVKLQSEVRHLSQSDTPALPDAMWDGQAIHQALVNLIDNAVKHTAKGGVVRAELSFCEENACIDFSVIDQGPGIEPADRERIFKPFERLGSEMTRKTKGVGIGLNLVWHTAQAHQGSVRVEQAPDGGACFVLSLPLQPKQKGML
jgi:signal transduction histidine kinase